MWSPIKKTVPWLSMCRINLCIFLELKLLQEKVNIVLC